MRIAILAVTVLSIILVTVLLNQYEGLIRQVAKHPSFTFSSTEALQIKPSKTDSIRFENSSVPVYHFGSENLTKKMIVLPGLGFYLDDWFSLCETISKSGTHVMTFPMEFSNTSREYSWGVTDRAVLSMMLDSLKSTDSLTITAFDFGTLSLDKLTVRPSVKINFINPRLTRSELLTQLADLSFGFSLTSPIKNIMNEFSSRMKITDSISFQINPDSRFFFNPNITIAEEFLNSEHTNLSDNWEYGKINVNETANAILKR